MNKTNIVNGFGDTPVSTRKVVSSNQEVPSHSTQGQIRKSTGGSLLEVDSPLLFASKEIFKETYRLMHQTESLELQGISEFMSKEIDKFSNIAMEQGVEASQLHVARYLLCTFIDEMLANAPWTSNSDWGGVSLLSKYYKESDGGEKFFQLLVRFEEEPTQYTYIMELAYVCLSFGYGGKYKQKNNSIHDLGAIKENLYRQIKTTKPKKEKFYANHPAAKRHHKLYSKLSRKIILAVALLFMLIVYAIFTYTVQSNESALITILEEEHHKIEGVQKSEQ